MSYNNSCNNSGNQSYDPYMMGGSYSGVSQSASYTGNSNNPPKFRETVQNCMQWSGNDSQGNNCWSHGSPVTVRGSKSMAAYPVVAPMRQNQGNWGKPRAFVSNGKGQGEGLSIPCQMGPLGTNPQSLMKPMEAVTVRINAPTPSCNSKGGPMTFTLDPSQIYGSLFKQC